MVDTGRAPWNIVLPELDEGVLPVSQQLKAMRASIETGLDVNKEIADDAAASASESAASASASETSAATSAQEASQATDTANNALTVANGIAATAQAASDKSDQAIDTANDAKDLQLAKNAEPDSQVATYVTTPGTDTNAGVAQVIGDEFPGQDQIRNAPYQLLATDYGVQPGTGIDQTAAFQAALNAAAASGADLVLPSGIISFTNGWTWRCRKHALIANQGTVLDWTNATFNGPAITLDGTYRTAFGVNIDGATPIIAKNLVCVGPKTAGTTVDGIKVAGLSGGSASIWKATLENVSLVGFRTQEILGTGSWLVNHKAVSYRRAVQYAVDFQAGSQAGEMYSWDSASVFDNCAMALHSNAAGAMDASFDGTSFDYCDKFGDLASGTFTFNGCHTERDWRPGVPMFTLRGATAAGKRSPNIIFNGGVIVATTTPAAPSGTAPLETVVVETINGSGVPPVVTATGTQLINTDTSMVLTLHKETANTGDWAGGFAWPVLSVHGVAPDLYGNNVTHSRISAINNELVDGQMKAGGTFAIDPSAASVKVGIDKWVTPNATTQGALSWDTAKMVVGDRSLKISQVGYNNGLVQHYFAARSRETYHMSFYWSCASFTGATKARITVYFFDVRGNNIGSRNLTNQIGPSIVTGTVAWTFAGGIIQAPPGAAIGLFAVDLSGGTGTFWLDDAQVVAI